MGAVGHTKGSSSTSRVGTHQRDTAFSLQVRTKHSLLDTHTTAIKPACRTIPHLPPPPHHRFLPPPVLLQNLLGNDCAKARVSLCVKGDPLCLPIQNVVSESGTAAAPEAVQQVAQALDAQCSVAEPTQAGVKVGCMLGTAMLGQC